jgi:transcription elongation factor GreA
LLDRTAPRWIASGFHSPVRTCRPVPTRWRANRRFADRAVVCAGSPHHWQRELLVTQTDGSVTWLTQDAYDRLKAELDHLTGSGRTELAAKIEAAREEGDLRENGGYHAAKEEQGKQEARIRQLSALLENAKVGEAPPDDGMVEAGMLVTVRFPDGDESTFVLGSREVVLSDSSMDVEVYSPQSPLGSAIYGKYVGQNAVYARPNGSKVTVEIVSAKPYTA